MSRSGGYKCYNLNCMSCVSRVLCGEHGDIALNCVDRIVSYHTNADNIRAMTDEELAKLLTNGCADSKCSDAPHTKYGSSDCYMCRLNWLRKPAEEN